MKKIVKTFQKSKSELLIFFIATTALCVVGLSLYIVLIIIQK